LVRNTLIGICVSPTHKRRGELLPGIEVGMMLRMRAFMFFVSCSALFASPALAGSIVIDDRTDSATAYWGGSVWNASSTAYGDVIGNPYYSVDKLEASIVNGKIQVTLTGQYFDSYQRSIDQANLFGPGDIYLQIGGYTKPAGGDQHNTTDQFTKSEGWDYVISFQNKSIYEFDFDATGESALNMTQLPSGFNSSQWIYRQNQAWRGGYGAFLSNDVDISFTDNTAHPELSTMTFTYSTLDGRLSPEMGYHWDMMCGNDVVEGGNTVPEPGTIVLLGLGLAGLAGIKRLSRRS
jgi:hypothetical protein